MSHEEVLSSRLFQGGGLMILLVLSSGCDKGWVAYQQIEIGCPLSPDHLLIRHGHGEGKAKGWSEFASGNIPPVIAWDGVGVLLDAEGKVMARRYVATALGYWGLFQTLAARSVMELEVPLPPFGKLPPISSSSRNRAVTLGEYLKSVEENVLMGLTQTQEDHLGSCFESGTALVFFTPLPYTVYCVSPFGMGPLGGIIDKFPGVMNQGYDLHFRDDYGRYFRIKNLGGRRIRIESSWFRIIDPISLALGIRLPCHLTVDAGIGEKQIKTETESGETSR